MLCHQLKQVFTIQSVSICKNQFTGIQPFSPVLRIFLALNKELPIFTFSCKCSSDSMSLLSYSLNRQHHQPPMIAAGMQNVTQKPYIKPVQIWGHWNLSIPALTRVQSTLVQNLQSINPGWYFHVFGVFFCIFSFIVKKALKLISCNSNLSLADDIITVLFLNLCHIVALINTSVCVNKSLFFHNLNNMVL